METGHADPEFCAPRSLLIRCDEPMVEPKAPGVDGTCGPTLGFPTSYLTRYRPYFMTTSDVLARRATRWLERRSFVAADLPTAAEAARRARASGISISVALPALNEEATVGSICRSIRDELIERAGVVDELVVIDGGSSDNTALVARDAGARVVRACDLIADIPSRGGKGDSLWRSLSVLSGDIVCWIDADIRNFEPHFVTRLVAPLIDDAEIAFVKATYRRPLDIGGTLLPTGGGRVTELLARPLLASFFPELSGLRQPLAGEYAGRREVLRSLPFFSGYSVEVGLLIDILGAHGLDAIAQADLGVRIHRNRPLEDLAPMASAIARTIVQRARAWGRLAPAVEAEHAHDEVERPSLDSLEDIEATA